MIFVGEMEVFQKRKNKEWRLQQKDGLHYLYYDSPNPHNKWMEIRVSNPHCGYTEAIMCVEIA